MPTQLQFRRGTTATFTGARNLIDTDTENIRVHDGLKQVVWKLSHQALVAYGGTAPGGWKL